MRSTAYLLILTAICIMHPAEAQTITASDSLRINDTTECLRLARSVDIYSGGYYQKAYDTTKMYLLVCPDLQDPRTAFSRLDGFNSQRSNAPTRFVEYREWLKSVLYYRQYDEWYCADAFSLLSTFNYFPERGDMVDPGGALAVARFLLSTGRCSRDSAFLAQAIQGDREVQIVIWRDTVTDSIHYPNPDTTVPTLEDLGLGLLRGQNAVATHVTVGPRLSGATASTNPFTNSTAILFKTGEYTLVKLELFDALGNLVGGNLIGQVLDPGNHRFEIDGNGLAAGTYYARLSCLSGEHVTVKLVKE